MSSDEVYSRISKNNKHMGPIGHILLWIVFFLFVFFLLGCGLFTYYAATAPNISYNTLSSDNSTTIYDKNGKVVSRLGMQNRDYVKSKDIPDNLKNAIISVEDRHFYSDKGVDPVRIVKAAVSNVFGSGGLQGGSTLTQQLVKLSVFSTKSSDQTLKRKAQEAWLAVQVDKAYSKQQILEFYINKVYMGNSAYGMQTASEVLFNKPLSELNLSQTALLAGLPQAPVSYNPVNNPKYAKARRDQVLTAMVKNKTISQAEANKAMKENVQAGINKDTVNNTPTQKDEKYADAYISQVTQELTKKGFNLNAGNKVYTNLDMDVQKKMYDLANSSDSNIAFPDNKFQVGATMVDPNNGKVISMLGSRKQDVAFGLNRAVQTDRSSGSTMKPLMDYGPAIEYLNYPTYQTVKDTPYTYPGTNIQLNDFDNRHEGNITMRKALVESRNIPAIRTLETVGIDRATNFLKGLGMTFEQPLTLQNGIGAYISTEQEAAAYSAFANGGTYYKPYLIDKVVSPTGDTDSFETQSNNAMSESTAFMITQMLTGVINDSNGSGTAARISGLNAAGKTGTTKYPDSQAGSVPDDASMDSWFTGYTRNLSLSVWTGYDHPLEAGNYISQSQTEIAQQFYKEVMSYASSGLPNKNWTKPDDVVKTHTDGSDQYYIEGHAGDLKVDNANTEAQKVDQNKVVTNNNQNNNDQNKNNDNKSNNGTNASNEQNPSNNNQNNNNQNNQNNNNNNQNTQNNNNQNNNQNNQNNQNTQNNQNNNNQNNQNTQNNNNQNNNQNNK
ncbi:PBP1A family penicillin-binding protein [Fructilactobacillus vespulae]|uniref:PBP1A family penicillin-binding protein n=1 Tax=Fructilactobacillus vespulae TaxID=1249630 RepID=UPI0039B43DEA